MRNLQPGEAGALIHLGRRGLRLALLLAAAAGNLFSASTQAQGVLTVTPSATVNTTAGTGAVGYSGDGGSAAAATLASPSAVAYDAAGNLYIAAAGNHVVREVVKATGNIVTVAGTGVAGFGGDNGAATSAYLDTPTGIAVDASGNLYIADSHNQRIRKVTGTTITTIAGTGSAGFSGDGAAATSATLNLPSAVAVDANGNVYIADTNNQRVRKLTGTVITTVAGTGDQGFSGDGAAATLASLDAPTGVAVDATGNIYIADRHNQRVRVVGTTGTINTLAGSGAVTFAGGFGGDGAAATSASLSKPTGVSIDAGGNVYVTDTNNQRVRQISGNTIGTLSGTGDQGFAGDGSASASTVLNAPKAVAADASGNIAIADTLDQRVRTSALPTLTFAAAVGTSSAGQSVTLANSGSAPIAVSSVAFSGMFRTASGGSCPAPPITLAPGANCTENVVYSPTTSGGSSGRVVFSGQGVLTQAVLLTGSSTAGATSVSVSSSANAGRSGVPVTLTATLSTAAATGTITFYANGTQIAPAQPVSNGTASITTTFSTGGNYSITAVYSGDSNYAGSTSPAYVETIGNAGFTLTAGGQTSYALTIARGSSGTFTITVTPLGNFSGTVTFSCSNLPANVTCYYFTPTLTFTGTGGSQTTALRIDSYQLSANAKATRVGSNSSPFATRLTLAFLFPGLLLLSGVGAARRRLHGNGRLFLFTLFAVSLIGTLAMSGCGSSSLVATNAAAGTYNVNIVATSGGVTQTLPLTLTIQ